MQVGPQVPQERYKASQHNNHRLLLRTNVPRLQVQRHRQELTIHHQLPQDNTKPTTRPERRKLLAQIKDKQLPHKRNERPHRKEPQPLLSRALITTDTDTSKQGLPKDNTHVKVK